jgi:hypothetical protein
MSRCQVRRCSTPIHGAGPLIKRIGWTGLRFFSGVAGTVFPGATRGQREGHLCPLLNIPATPYGAGRNAPERTREVEPLRVAQSSRLADAAEPGYLGEPGEFLEWHP